MERPISYRPPPVSPHKPAEDDSQQMKLCLFCEEPAAVATLLCSTCKIPLCDVCFRRHSALNRYAGHRSVPYEDWSWCPIHLKKQVLMCSDCTEKCCLICANFGKHKGHRVMDKEMESRIVMQETMKEIEEVRGIVIEKICRKIEEVGRRIRDLGEWEENGCRIIIELAEKRRMETRSVQASLSAQLTTLRTSQFSSSIDATESYRRLSDSIDPSLPSTLRQPFDFTVNLDSNKASLSPSPLLLPPSPKLISPDTSDIPLHENLQFSSAPNQSFELATFEDVMESEPDPVNPVMYMLCNDSRDVVKLDMRTDQWEILATDRLWPRFCNFTLINKETLFGSGGGLVPSKKAFSLNLRTFRSSEEPQMITPRNHHGLVTYSSTEVLAIGGICKHIQVKCELYRLSDRQWQEVSPLNQARAAMGTCVYLGEVYVFGGWDGRKEIKSIEKFDQSMEWVTLSLPLPEASQCNAVVYESRILIFAFKPGKIYEMNSSYISEFGRITNEAWCRPELRLYQNAVYSFRSGELKVIKYYLKEGRFQVVSLEAESGRLPR